MNLIPTAQAIAPTPDDFYDMEEMCIEYPESPRCYGPDPGMSASDWMGLLILGGILVGAAMYESGKKNPH